MGAGLEARAKEWPNAIGSSAFGAFSIPAGANAVNKGASGRLTKANSLGFAQAHHLRDGSGDVAVVNRWNLCKDRRGSDNCHENNLNPADHDKG